MSHDVIVVGGGGAGMCAALSAREQGASVLVLERAPAEQRGGNTAFASGSFRMVHHGADDIKKVVPDLTEHEIATHRLRRIHRGAISSTTSAASPQYNSDPELADFLVQQQHRHGALAARAAVCASCRTTAVRRSSIEGRFKFFGGSVIYANGGGEGLDGGAFKTAEKHGVDIRYGARGVSLLRGAMAPSPVYASR